MGRNGGLIKVAPDEVRRTSLRGRRPFKLTSNALEVGTSIDLRLSQTLSAESSGEMSDLANPARPIRSTHVGTESNHIRVPRQR